MLHHAKFGQNRLNRGRDMAIFRFFKMAAWYTARSISRAMVATLEQTNQTPVTVVPSWLTADVNYISESDWSLATLQSGLTSVSPYIRDSSNPNPLRLCPISPNPNLPNPVSPNARKTCHLLVFLKMNADDVKLNYCWKSSLLTYPTSIWCPR